MTSSHVLTWADVERLSAALAGDVAAAAGVPAFDRVVGVSRGGLVPAALVACRMAVKHVETVQVRLYAGTQRLPAPEVLGARPAREGPAGDPRRTLVVDELLDTGRTLAEVHTLFPEATLCALVARGGHAEVARHADLVAVPCTGTDAGPSRVWVGEVRDTDRWIVFPWSPAEDRTDAGGPP